ncbi:MAG: hypothetical protein ACKVU2_16375 [Saprospiraceae bacterium]
MIQLARSCFSDILGISAPAKVIAVIGVCLFLAVPVTSNCQRTVVFQWNGQNYRADFTWAVKHADTEYKSRAAHTIDRSKDPTFDLEATFRFRNDSIPTDNDVVWGFQFRQAGNIISPATNEKFTRSLRIFQRFQVDGTGNATLTVTPKVWKRNAAGQFDPIGQATPVTIGFSVTDAPPAAAIPVVTGPASEPTTTPPTNLPTAPPAQVALPQPVALQAEAQAYAEALKEPDSLRPKALLNFIEQYGNKPGAQSTLVGKALKDVPLGTSQPEKQSDGTFTYTLVNAVRPVVDSASVQGWKWKLSEFGKGRFQLTLNDIGDTAHSIRIADLGKNAPYNLARDLLPFERIRVTLVGETWDSFQIRVTGGEPPFFVYLSKGNVPKIRYTLTATNQTWSLDKGQCEACKNGQHTVEVYNNDFSTLLLRAESAVHIRRVNYFYRLLSAAVAILLVYFFYKPIIRAWRHFRYQSQLRDIEAWEKRVEEEEKRRRRDKQ